MLVNNVWWKYLRNINNWHYIFITHKRMCLMSCTPRRSCSAFASAKSGQSRCWSPKETLWSVLSKGPPVKGWADCIAAQIDLRLQCAYSTFCHFRFLYRPRHTETYLRSYADSENAVWSWLLLCANRIIGCYRMYELRANAQIICCACAGWICAFCACSKSRFRLTQPK